MLESKDHNESGEDIFRVDLKPISSEHIKHELEKGLYLSKKVLDRIDFEEGHFLTFLPFFVPYGDYQWFEHGWARFSVRSEVHRFIRNEFDGSDCKYLIGEDVAARVSDRWLQEKFNDEAKYITFGERLYWYTRSDDISKIAATISHASGANQFNGFITSVPEPNMLESNTTISEVELDYFADNVSHIIVSAYDGCSYLIWDKGR